MATILIVDDSAVDRQWAGGLIQEWFEGKVAYAENGRVALEAIAKEAPDLVLTDMQMPEMNGLELVEQIRSLHPGVPVILMTAHGSEDIAIAALKKGAATYIPKRQLVDDMAEIDGILSLTRAGREERTILDYLVQSETHFEINNDLTLIPALIAVVEKGLTRMKLCDDTGKIRVAVALREALVNAIVHGNLEVSSSHREGDGKVYYDLIETRQRLEPYRSRRARLTIMESRSQAVYVVSDDGPGFDPTGLPDPTDPANLEQVSGRGLLLIRTFMDEVQHGDDGREISMVFRGDRK